LVQLRSLEQPLFSAIHACQLIVDAAFHVLRRCQIFRALVATGRMH